LSIFAGFWQKLDTNLDTGLLEVLGDFVGDRSQISSKIKRMFWCDSILRNPESAQFRAGRTQIGDYLNTASAKPFRRRLAVREHDDLGPRRHGSEGSVILWPDRVFSA